MSDFALTELLGIHRATVAVADRPSSGPVVTGRSGLVLDGAGSVVIRPGTVPPRSRPPLTGFEPAAVALRRHPALWVPDAGRWRQGAVLGEAAVVKVTHSGPNHGTLRVLVEWVADRTGRLVEALYAVSELRLRDVTS